MIHVDVEPIGKLPADVGQFKYMDAPDLSDLMEKDHRPRPPQAQARQINEFSTRPVNGNGIGQIMAKSAVSPAHLIAVFALEHLPGEIF